jgi:DNA-binding NarL/FixJ family response regulator
MRYHGASPPPLEVMRALRVLLVDDSRSFRAQLCAALDDGCEIVGEAGSGRHGLQLALELRPGVVVVDLDLPDVSGIAVARRITAAIPSTGVLVLATQGSDGSMLAAVRAGARGYLLKSAGDDEVLRAVQAVGNGELIFGRVPADGVLDHLRRRGAAGTRTALTERERQVLELMASGVSNSLIADRLGISHKTVRNHVSHIFGKLHVEDRAQAIIRARQAGLFARRDAFEGTLEGRK